MAGVVAGRFAISCHRLCKVLRDASPAVCENSADHSFRRQPRQPDQLRVNRAGGPDRQEQDKRRLVPTN